jgi:hypothetical protein
MKFNCIIGLLFVSLRLFSQSDDLILNSSIQNSLDSLKLWNYDILNNDKEDSNLICKIVFFRNTPIKDQLFEKVYKTGLKPTMIFNVYPISMVDSVKKMSRLTRVTSSCLPPNVGGDYYVLKNFVLLNYSSCTLCSSSSTSEKIDFCRGNVDKIVSKVKDKEYNNFVQLCNDLPIEKGKYK